MAETLLSPGVLARESDQSFLTQQPVQAGAAILGPTVKGPVGIPTIVTSYSDYKNKFGAVVESGSDEYTYFTSIAAYNYFQQGGNTLLVTRVVSGSYTSATSSIVLNNENVVGANPATGSLDFGGTFGTTPEDETRFTVEGTEFRFIAQNPEGGLPVDSSPIFFLATGSSGTTYLDQLKTKVGNVGIGVDLNVDSTTLQVTSSATGVGGNSTTLSTGSGTDTFTTRLTLEGGTNGVGTNNAFILETLSEGEAQNSTSTTGSAGQLPSGSKENLRWEIVEPNVSSGTFNLLIRRGDDITNSKTVLETWTNLTLDPNSPNYISRVIGDQKQVVTSDNGTFFTKMEGNYRNASRFVRVKSINSKTLNYFDNAGNPKSEFTGSIPIASQGTFGSATGAPFEGIAGTFYENIGSAGINGGDNAQGLEAANYNDSISLLANKDEYRYNLLLAPGLFKKNMSSQITTMIDNCQVRGDAMAVVDMVPYSSTITTVTGQAAGIDSSYAATYWPWVQTIDPDLGDQVWVPASTMIAGVYAFNDSSTEAWFAPAGLNRGGMSTVVRAERKLTNGNRDTLYEGKVNPIATFPNSGVVVFGQKTLQKKPSALDRVNVRRLLIELKSFISQVADNLVFEQNTIATRNNFLTQVNPFLESVQQRQGLFAFKVIMDDSNNTPDVIDRNQLIGQIFIQPTRTAEFIYLDFNILPTGAVFPS